MGFVGFLAIALLLGMFLLFIAVMFARFYRKVEQGKALIVNKMQKDPEVTFTGAVVFPVIHKAEVMDISVKTIEIDRRGKEGLICQDNIRADIKVTFFVRVNKTQEDVIKVAQAIGCVRASDQKTLEELFSAKFSEALKTVGKKLDFVDLYTKRNEFRDWIIEIIGRDLNGYVLEDAAIDFLEQTPLNSLDGSNILDAQGIRKITQLTSIEHVRTNEFTNNERKLIKKQDVEAEEAILELERQRTDAEAKQQREIKTVKAREQAEIDKVSAEERLRAETARIAADEELQIAEENRKRQVEVAEKNRERVVAIETERVEKARALEEVDRTREVELQRIEMEKQLEEERRLIAEVTREKIAVEKTVAEEEERIKALRVVEEAKRNKEALVIAAEAEAEEVLIKDIKAAEASEAASKFKAKEILVLADAELAAADKEAKAKIRLAEGIQAQEAALGLAQVRVQDASAAAVEKVGLAEARVTREKGDAEAGAVRAAMSAEASGITDKAEAMKLLDEESREHEEYRLHLEKDREVELEAIRAHRVVAEEQAGVLAEALRSAKIDIVGGESVFFDKVVNAISMGKSLDSFMGRSETAQALVGDYLTGESSLTEDVKDVLSRPSVSSGDVQNLAVSALLGKLALTSGDEKRGQIEKLIEAARELGL